MTPRSPLAPGPREPGTWGFRAVAARGVAEVRPGDDLVSLLAPAWQHAGTEPSDGDVLVVTSKVVSKAEGRVLAAPRGEADRDAAVTAETDREVARRAGTRIVRTRHGFVMAAAGVDTSNVEAGSLVLLPLDPDASARRLRDDFRARGVNLGVVVSDTSGRAWRSGQTDVALGAAGIVVLDDHHGRVDPYGNALAVTAPAVADEMAAAAELATGKLSGSPACLLRGLGRHVLPAGEHGPGAAALVRPESSDMFGLGSREAVVAALRPDSRDAVRGFGAAVPADEVRAVLDEDPGTTTRRTDSGVEVRLPDEAFAAGRALGRVEALLRAHGWRVDQVAEGVVRAVPAL